MDSVTIKSCRICLDTKFSESVSFDDSGEWAAMYEFCFDLSLSIEDVPRKLCGVCAKKMEEFYKFKLQTHKSDKLWKTIVNIKPIEKGIDKKPSLKPDGLAKSRLKRDQYSEKSIDKKPSLKLEQNSEISLDEYPSLENIKQEYDDVEYLDCSDVEVENVDKISLSEPLEKEEKPDCGDEDNHVIADDECAEDSDEVNDKKHASQKIYTCERCKIEYKKLKCYKKHLKKNNCKFNENPVPKLKSEKPTEYYCGLCDMRSPDAEVIKTHFAKHSEENDLSCKLCDFLGKDFADMVTHRYSHYPYRNKTFLCHICGKRTHVLLILQFHYRTLHLKKKKGGICTVCSREFQGYKHWRNHERWHKEPQFICDICGRKFLFKNSIIEHMKYHYAINPYVCDICGKGFKRNSSLTLHLRSTHDNEKVNCSHCGKDFKNQFCLDTHLKIVAREKRYQCEICSKCYEWPNKLQKHMIWHLKDRPHVCNLCGATYKVKSQLTIHMRKHTGLMPFKCLLCNKGFTSSNQLKVHASVHTGVRRYKCTYCERSFHNKKDVILHCDKAHHVTDFKLSVPKKET
ncbi:hypothetical protein ABMA27_001915 [Loxostege sticticalis]|uniref:Uncharacterized protein n=1 Tax=Loxostege sticticalis TaxID=481309 RepID=A0ABR3HW29_LOXSC